ncbi:DUF2809 domain-containing protein [Glaciibacter superstes]|uniref:ribosomal maturation YjgA family protein n=1 Tax=Glaciibacter superstes TaxID=501023 RepID=UPI0004150BC8|nr:DUF2809 domain-containing protein [Glaciibacter superstes]
MPTKPGSTHGRRRPALLVVGILTIAAGHLVHFTMTDAAGQLAADALYAVLAYLVIALAFPVLRRALVAVIAFAACALIELFQLTDVPLLLAEAFPPARLVLGTTFAPLDLVAYAVGVVAACILDGLARRTRRESPTAPS